MKYNFKPVMLFIENVFYTFEWKRERNMLSIFTIASLLLWSILLGAYFIEQYEYKKIDAEITDILSSLKRKQVANMSSEKKTFLVDNSPVEVDVQHVESFLKKYPNSIEAKSFIVGKDTYDIPLNEVDGFISEFPNAQPLHEESSYKNKLHVFLDFNYRGNKPEFTSRLSYDSSYATDIFNFLESNVEDFSCRRNKEEFYKKIGLNNKTWKEDKLKKFYDKFSNDYDLPEYDTFMSDMQDETKRKTLYDNLSKDYELPVFETFTMEMGMKKPAKQSYSTPNEWDKLGILYSALSLDDVYKDKVGTEQEFRDKISNPDKASMLYSALSSDDVYKDKVGTEDEFYTKIGLKKRKRFHLNKKTPDELPADFEFPDELPADFDFNEEKYYLYKGELYSYSTLKDKYGNKIDSKISENGFEEYVPKFEDIEEQTSLLSESLLAQKGEGLNGLGQPISVSPKEIVRKKKIELRVIESKITELEKLNTTIAIIHGIVFAILFPLRWFWIYLISFIKSISSKKIKKTIYYLIGVSIIIVFLNPSLNDFNEFIQ